MIDFHSHVLPEIDDGSRSVEESIAILEKSRLQGVSIIAATPHFYPWENSPRRFLERREAALARLLPQLTADCPEIVPGAELRFFEGISETDVSAFTLAGSRLLLLEMPFSCWNGHMLGELEKLCSDSRYRVMLAHIERYLPLQRAEVWDRLLDFGALMQANAEFFINIGSRRRALRMLRDGYISVLGSDCHNITSRPPALNKAAAVIERTLGREVLTAMDKLGAGLLSEKPDCGG